MIHMLKHNTHLKHNNKHLIKDTVTASKMTVSNVKQQQYCNYNSDMK